MMDLTAPSIPGLTDELFGRALDAFLSQAYPGGVPARVVGLLASAFPSRRLHLESRAFEVMFDPRMSVPRMRYDLRIGWIRFPHLKITVETSPDGRGPLFSVNTHDRILLRPSNDPEFQAIHALICDNTAFKEKMERLWEAQNVPTFKSYLRTAMNRRKG